MSHICQLLIEGTGATKALEQLVPAALQEMIPGQPIFATDSKNGGILDDLMLTRWDDESGV